MNLGPLRYLGPQTSPLSAGEMVMTPGLGCPAAHTAGGDQTDLRSDGGPGSLATALPLHQSPPVPSVLTSWARGGAWTLSLQWSRVDLAPRWERVESMGWLGSGGGVGVQGWGREALLLSYLPPHPHRGLGAGLLGCLAGACAALWAPA